MRKADLVFKILGLTTSVAIGIISLVMEAKRKRTLTEEDKNDIADRVAKRLKPKKVEKVIQESK